MSMAHIGNIFVVFYLFYFEFVNLYLFLKFVALMILPLCLWLYG